jgi:serine O-acetyltransferase
MRRLAQDRPGLEVLTTIREDLALHGSLSSPGFHALCMYRFGHWRNGLARGPLRQALRIPYLLWHRRIRNRYRIEVHATAAIGRRVRLADEGDIVLGNDVVIGDGCVISHGVTLGKASQTSSGWPELGRSVQVSTGAVIIGGITVGDGAVIGPNTVIWRDVPPGAMVTLQPPETRPARHGSKRADSVQG